ncbi:MAG: nuclear transport factor 2 family protein [Candidatus Caldarchaeum sp.]|nr:nuclear transport factor 2 family protein [Candidatus Caldarchaeum sp.]
MNKTAEEIYQTVVKSFEAGKQGLSDDFNDLHSARYTRYSDLPPYHLQERDEALQLKTSLLTQLVDFEYNIENFRVITVQDTAVAFFILHYRGMAINDYAFEGKVVEGSARCTLVLERIGGSWKILHEHLSRTPEGFSLY